MTEKFIKLGDFDPSNPPGRNAFCPCKSGKKYKNCHSESVKDALRIMHAHHIVVQQKLRDLTGSLRLPANKNKGWVFDTKVVGSQLTYSYEGRDILMIDYHDLPMSYNNVFDTDKIANANIEDITYTEIKPLTQEKGENDDGIAK